jgi:quercetin dioxygenase-like cupin family protein
VDSWDIRSLDVEPHRPRVLRSDGEVRVIAINLPEGEELQEHQTHERAYLVVVDGKIQVDNGGETKDGGPGFVAHFEPNERREVRAAAGDGGARLLLFLGPWPGEGHHSHRA